MTRTERTSGHLALAAAALTLSACVAILEPVPDSRTTAAVVVPRSTVTAEMSLLTDFRVPVEITNFGPSWMLYDRWCGWRIEQLVNQRWVAAYYPVCSPHSQEFYDVPPGATQWETLPAHRSWRIGNGAGVEGVYRVVYQVYEETGVNRHRELPEHRTTSNSFQVRR